MTRVGPGAEPSRPFSADPTGQLFEREGRLLRGVAHESAARVRAMFDCGLVDELVRRRLLVPSRLSGVSVQGYALVVEHERVSPLVYPFEWSFSMLRDAALAVLELNEVARRYGFQTTDCHGFNVCFDGTAPLFVDLGSLAPVAPGFSGWQAYEEFLSAYEYPLRIWSAGQHYFARRALLGCGVGDRLTPQDYYIYRHSWLRPFAGRRLAAGLRALVHAAALPRNPFTAFARLRGAGALSRLRAEDVVRMQDIRFPALRRRIERLCAPRSGTAWAGYQGSYGAGNLPKRFARVLELLQACGARSVVELAGNEGAFALAATRLPHAPKVTCTDADAHAVDAAYSRARREGTALTAAVLDFMFPMTNYAGNRPPHERYRADAVVALAVTHHLVLGQNLALEDVMRSIAAYAGRFAFIEFMPLGLYSPGEPAQVPAWYTAERFKTAFEASFHLDGVEPLEENRVLYWGRVRSPAA